MVSIIVPIYKAENYIARCVDSILAQTYQDWELLLVDDGSPDNSGAICDEYASKDKRIKSLHKANGGVSSARNYGLDNASGEWITFIDADDYIKGDFFGLVGKCNADIIINKSEHFDDNLQAVPGGCSMPKMLITKTAELQAFLRYYSYAELIRAPWGKIFRRSLISDIRFDESMRIGEDTHFVFRTLSRMPRVLIANAGTYMFFESDVSPFKKYAIPEDVARYTLISIYEVYDAIGTNCVELDYNLYAFFSMLCTGGKDSNLWSKIKTPLFCRLQKAQKEWLTFRYKVIRVIIRNNFLFLYNIHILKCIIKWKFYKLMYLNNRQ